MSHREGDSWTAHVPHEAAMEELGARFARAAKPPCVFLLEGELGAGKTTFVRGFVGALTKGTKGAEEEDHRITVQSPTYALARSYPTTPTTHHLDLYRLQQSNFDAYNLEDLGLWDLLEDPTALVLVEWPRALKIPPVIPQICLSIMVQGDARVVVVAGADEDAKVKR